MRLRQNARWRRCMLGLDKCPRCIVTEGDSMQRWTSFIVRHPNAHVLVGRTRNITQWRNNALVQLIKAAQPSGQFSVRRDLEEEQGY